ncbi:acyl-CoA dehydrogenase family protein [Streptosporangium sp. CA-115845]|uniref:acyl-CoA dehydrogenase family protein n=1 Tax=Streptosporangium sp. CA-115845 TaxID=3240071 RepID=UPI003D8BD3F0
MRLTDAQTGWRDRARQFASEQIAPLADQIDQQQITPASVLVAMRENGYLGAALPARWGGGGIDPVSYGLVTEEIGKACSSVRSLMTVHNMAAQALVALGDRDQHQRWLPELCAGKKIIAFALSEPNAGSAAHAIETQAVKLSDGYLVSGTKKWITFGQIADLFLVFAHYERKPVALVVDRHSDGLTVTPAKDIFGTRGSMLAEVRLDNVHVPRSHQVGPTGMGISFVANWALDHGRFSVAWGSTGIMQGCLDACVSYTQQRRQGDHRLKDHQLVRRHLTDMLVAHTAAQAVCYRSACLREVGDPRAVMETAMAKYHAAGAAIRVATDAVHLHGANGCTTDYPVARYLRDATVAGIIEGTHEIHQVTLADYAFQRPYLR